MFVRHAQRRTFERMATPPTPHSYKLKVLFFFKLYKLFIYFYKNKTTIVIIQIKHDDEDAAAPDPHLKLDFS